MRWTLWLGLMACSPDDATREDPDPSDGPLVLQGYVCSPGCQARVPNATVRLEDFQTTTDANGEFTLDVGDLRGQYRISASTGHWHGYEDLTLDDSISAIPLPIGGTTSVAVVRGEYDDIESILDDIGVEYDDYLGTSPGWVAELAHDPVLLGSYDVVFINCGVNYDDWDETAAANVADLIEGGAGLYVSDWAYWVLETAEPGHTDFYGEDETLLDSARGVAGTVTADVVDARTEVALGKTTATLTYDLDVWIAVEGTGTPLLTGEHRIYNADYTQQSARTAPLAGRTGNVVYTSFHNEAQITEDMEALLQDFIWSL